MMRAFIPAGGGVAAARARRARRWSSRFRWSGMVELLAQGSQRTSQVAARGSRLAPDQCGAFVDRVAVLVVQRDDRTLLAAQAPVAPIEVQVRSFRRWAR